MNSRTKAVHSVMLGCAAFIWGFAFVAQSTGGDALGPFAFNWIRNLIAAAAVFVIVKIRDVMGKGKKPKTGPERKRLVRTGVFCGITLFIASTLQQVGISYGTPVGKAGFLTACYILLVPIVGIFLKKSCGWNVWVGAVIMLFGIYMLCMEGGLSLGQSDVLVLLCSVFFTIQITLISTLVQDQDTFRISSIEFLTVGILGAPFAFFIDMGGSLSGAYSWWLLFITKEALGPVLFAAIFSSGIAYTFQMVGQQGVNPTLASMLMSMESMFSVLGGWLILHETLTPRELTGCAIMLIAIVLAQMPVKRIRTT